MKFLVALLASCLRPRHQLLDHALRLHAATVDAVEFAWRFIGGNNSLPGNENVGNNLIIRILPTNKGEEEDGENGKVVRGLRHRVNAEGGGSFW